MPRVRWWLLAACILFAALTAHAAPATARALLHATRTSAGDLEIGGDLAGLPAGSTRYLRYEDLLKLPQREFNIDDDPNFTHPTHISGIPLSELIKLLGQSAGGDMVVAICYDQYHGIYTRSYISAHGPMLVLTIDGHTRDSWPHAPDGKSLAPYLISHPTFKPAPHALPEEDEREIPYGITRLEFHRESTVLDAIRPPGQMTASAQGLRIWQAYRIVQRDCYRCHNQGEQGGTMAGVDWDHLSAIATHDPTRFMSYVANPTSLKPTAQMPPHSNYTQQILQSITLYFQTFSQPGR